MRTLAFLYFYLISYSVYSQSWFQTGQQADLMVSGLGFNNSGGPLLFNHPNGLASDGSRLLMCDRFNNRILVWNKAPESWNQLPDLVLGQSNFIDNDPGSEKSQLNWPGNVAVSSNGSVAVADTENDRILFWEKFPVSNGQAADIAIHLPTICPPGVPQLWAWPWGVWTDGNRLAAVATQGSTLLFWNSIPTNDNQAPDYTITHPHFGTPRNISSDGSTYFFVGDHNAKVNGMPGTFFWNGFPTVANQPYDFYRNEWIKGTKLSDGKLIAGGLRNIYIWNQMPVNASQGPSDFVSPACYDNGDGVDVVEANGRVYVCNYNGNSVLVYNSPPSTSQPDPNYALGVNNFNHNTLDSIGYIQNPSFSSDGKRMIITSDYDKRIYIYHNFPASSGQFADEVISTQPYNLAPWDNALYNNTFAAAGRNNVCIWNNANNLVSPPSQIFNGAIGNATFSDLKGVALDHEFFYLADKAGKVYIWKGIPQNNTVNPSITLNLGNVALNRLSSDGTYLCVTQQSPASVYIYQIADLIQGKVTPWKTINQPGLLNLPAEAITFNGSLAIANQGYHDVLLWRDITNAPESTSMVVLGQSTNSPANRPQIGFNRLFMPGALLHDNNALWVGEFKFSSRILRFSYSPSNSDNIVTDAPVTVYPNPTRDGILLTAHSSALGDKYQLYDLDGKLVQSGIILNETSFIDMQILPAGAYVLYIKNRPETAVMVIKQ